MTPKIWANLSVAGRSMHWQRMTPVEKDQYRSDAGLDPALIGLEGWRVEIVHREYGYTERGIVSRSSGWQPCHILLKLRTSSGGIGIMTRPGDTITRLYKVR